MKGQLSDQCESLLIHCHGGGFVAQSSRSHEVYLRTWTSELDIPILSIDYSLAPEAPYPRAVEEVLYAYVWALKHANSMLGSTVKKVIFIGEYAELSGKRESADYWKTLCAEKFVGVDVVDGLVNQACINVLQVIRLGLI